jgi:hypothetical protein
MGDWCNMPGTRSRADILDTFNVNGMDRWRNPMRVMNVTGSWPNPPANRAQRHDPRAEEFSDILGLEKKITGRSPFRT